MSQDALFPASTVGVRLPGLSRARLERAAADAGVTVSAFVRELIEPTVNERTADRILQAHSRQLTQSLRGFFRDRLIEELTAGTPEGATRTEVALAELRDLDPDVWIDDRAKVLLDERPELRELAKVDRAKAFKMALKLAGKELRGDTDGQPK